MVSKDNVRVENDSSGRSRQLTIANLMPNTWSDNFKNVNEYYSSFFLKEIYINISFGLLIYDILIIICLMLSWYQGLVV